MSERRLHGRGGQGTVMAAQMLAGAFVEGGKYASVFPTYGIERRGSAVLAFARFSDEPIREKTRVYYPEYLLVLDPSLLSKSDIYNGFIGGGTIICCGTEKDVETIRRFPVRPSRIAVVDGIRITVELTGTNITNVVMLGAFARATGLVPLEYLRTSVKEAFHGRILEKNLEALQRGYNETKVFDFEAERSDVRQEMVFEKEKYACEAPPETAYEAAWTLTNDRYLIIRTGEWRFKRPVVDRDGCKKCGWCQIYCPTHCIHQGEAGYYLPDLEYCKGCGICANECPAMAIQMKLEEDCK